MVEIMYIFIFNVEGLTYENPEKITKEQYETKYGRTIEEGFKRAADRNYQMAYMTQTEYDSLNNDYKFVYFHTKTDPTVTRRAYQETKLLVNGKVVPITFDMIMSQQRIVGGIENTKDDYDKQLIINALLDKVNLLKSQSSTKLAAYIIKCEEYLSQHIGDIKADSLTSIIGTNGKIDVVKLEAQIKANTEKKDSMADLCEVYLAWILAIENGTQADLDMLPDEDPTKLNATIDSLWKAEHDKERKALIAVLHATEAEFAIVDKYTAVVQGDEPEVDNEE